MAKKKKKKKTGSTRPTYAKGRAPSAPAKGRARGGGVPAKGAAGERKADGTGSASAARGEKPVPQFNLIRRGTLEMKVFQAILAVLAVAALLQYPLWSEVTRREYAKSVRKYEAELEKWEKKYDSKAERKKHEEEKPVKPKKMTFNDFVIFYALMAFVEGGLFAFIGLNVSRRTDLGTPLLDRGWDPAAAGAGVADLLKYAVPAGVVVMVPLLATSFIGRSLGYSKTIRVQYAAWKDALYYAGFSVQNQMLLVLLMMSALVWLLTRYRYKTKVEPHLGGLFAAVVLGFGYFFYISRAGSESTAVGLAASSLLALSLVAVPGYLFWKKGLEYSLLAGAIGFGIYPFLAGFIVS